MLDVLLYFFKELVLALLSVLSTAMLARAILHFFDPFYEWRLSAFLFALTEPLILPYRKLCAKKHWFEGSPLDVPFFFAVLTLIILEMILEMI